MLMTKPVILWDMDGTLANGRPIPHVRARPGITLTLHILETLGYENHAWSANGAHYAHDICFWLELPITQYHSKPLVMNANEASRELGFRAPALQVDDVADDRIWPWEFHHVTPWWSDPASEETREAHAMVGEAVVRAGQALEALRAAYTACDGDAHLPKRGWPHICGECGALTEECWAHQAREVLVDVQEDR